MKRITSLFSILIACMGVFAQTDVTNTYLVNTGFDQEPITFIESGKNPSAERILGGLAPDRAGWVHVIPGWTNASVVNANAAQVSTAIYGAAASGDGMNSVAPPASGDILNNTEGACIHFSAGWGDKAIITQEVALPAGKYTLQYDIYNAHTNTAVATNYCGYVTDVAATYSTLNTVTQDVWMQDAVNFTVRREGTIGKISMGVTTSTEGSGNGAKLFVDNVKLIFNGEDRTELDAELTAKISEANELLAEGGTGDELTAAVGEAQIVLGNTSATMTEVDDAIIALTDAIWKHKITNAGVDNPLDMTPFIVNPSFETGDLTGWSGTVLSDTGAKPNSNATYTISNADGNYVFNTWNNGGVGYGTSQTINNLPNGKYELSVLVATDNGNTVTVFANEDTNPYVHEGDKGTGVTVTVSTIVLDGVLTIGTKDGSWYKMDNFRLKYLGVDLTALNDILIEKKATAQDALDATGNPGGYNEAELQAAIAQANAVEQTEASFDAAIAALIAAIDNYNAIIEKYEPLKEKLALANSLPTDYPGFSDFSAVIDEVQGVFDYPTELGETQLNLVITTLVTSIKTYVLTQEATEDNPADFTLLIDNAGFDGKYTEFAKPNTDRAVYQPEGWTAEYSGGDTNDMTYVAASYTQDNIEWSANEGLAYFARQRWAPEGCTIGLNQEIQNLPAGDYVLKFYAAAFGAGTSTVYVNDETETVTVESTDPAAWTEYTIAFTLEEAGNVTIGFRSIKGNANFKTAYDSFTLQYLGEEEDTPIAVNEVNGEQNINIWTKDGVIIADIDLVSATNVDLAIYNLQGMMLASETLACSAGKNQKTIGKALGLGIYIVKITCNGETKALKMVK